MLAILALIYRHRSRLPGLCALCGIELPCVPQPHCPPSPGKAKSKRQRHELRQRRQRKREEDPPAALDGVAGDMPVLSGEPLESASEASLLPKGVEPGSM